MLGIRLTRHPFIILWLLVLSLMNSKTKKIKKFSILLESLILRSLIVWLQGFLGWIKISWILQLRNIRKIWAKGMKTLSNLLLLKRIKMQIHSIPYLLLLVDNLLMRSMAEILRHLLDLLIKVVFLLETENLILCKFKLKQNLLVIRKNKQL